MEKALNIISIVFNLMGTVLLFLYAQTIMALAMGLLCAFIAIFLTIGLFQKKLPKVDSLSIPSHKPTEDWVDWHSDTPL